MSETQGLESATNADVIRSTPEKQTEKIEITRENNHVVVKTDLNLVDMRPAIEAMLEGVAEDKEQGETPAPPPPAATAKDSAPPTPAEEIRIIDFYLNIKELLLPNDIKITGVSSFLVYEDKQSNKNTDDIFDLIESLGSAVSTNLLLGLKRLQLDGKVLSDKKLSDISVRIAPIDSTQRSVLIRSSDMNAMMKLKGESNFEGTDYVLHARWVDGKADKEDWEITGTVQLKDFHITSPSFLMRATGAFFSLEGFVSAMTSSRIYFEKMELQFQISKGKRQIHCKVYFGPETAVPCGDY